MNSVELKKSEGYFSRNSRWLRPFFAAILLILIAGALPGFSQAFGDFPVPVWLPMSGAVLAFFVCGIFAAQTCTLSASVVRFLAQFAAVATALSLLLR